MMMSDPAMESASAEAVTHDIDPSSEDTGRTPEVRRGMLVVAAALAAMLAVTLYLARTQVPAVDAYDDEPSRWSWAWFTEPIEFDRWLRPGTEAGRPHFRSMALAAEGRRLFAAGDKGVLLRSEDGGLSWQGRRIPGAATVVSVADAAGSLLVLDSNGALWRSTDGGRKWDSKVAAGSGLGALAHAPEGNTVLAVGPGRVMRSDNLGEVWRTLASPVPQGIPVQARAAKATGLPSEGPQWQQSTAPNAAARPKAPGKAEQKAPVARPVTPEPLPIPLPPVVAAAPPAPQLLAVVLAGKERAVGATRNALLYSEDGGVRWQAAAAPEGMRFRSLTRQGEAVLAVADSAVLRSADGGRSFTPVLETRSPLRTVAMTPRGRQGIAVTEQGDLFTTDDGGVRWNAAKKRWTQQLTSLATPDGKTLFGTDASGALLRAPRLEQDFTAIGSYARYPAPWFIGFAGFLMLPPVGAGLLAWRKQRKLLAKAGLLDNGVSDEPISRTEQDRLAFAPAVEALALFLRHSATTPPLAIAVNAPWGRGKTSFMRMLQLRLRHLGARPVWFNVWHHQHEDVLLAPLLQAITRQAIPSWWRWQGWRFRARLVFRRMRKLNDWGIVAGLAGLAIIPLYAACILVREPHAGAAAPQFSALDHLVRDLHSVWNFLLGGEWLATAKSTSLTDVLGAAFGALRSDPGNGYWLAGTVGLFLCLYMLATYLLRPFPANPGILAARLNSKFSLSQAEAKADFRQRFRENFGDVAWALSPRTLTVFIDDLDRCEPQKAAELLEAVNYLCESGRCFVVLGMARELVEAQIASAHKTLAEEQAVLERARRASEAGPEAKKTEDAHPTPERDRLAYARKYLRKLVQLDVQLPMVEDGQAVDLLLQQRRKQEEESQSRQARWKRARAIGGGLFMPSTLVLAVALFVAGLFVQGRQTLGAMEGEAHAAAATRDAKLDEVEAFLRKSRRFEQVLRLQAERGGTGVPVASLRSDADVIATHVKAVEAAVPALRKETTGFEKLLATAFVPHEAALKELRKDYEEQERKGGRTEFTAALTPEANAPPGPQAAQVEGSVAAPGAQLPSGDVPDWPYALAMLPVVLLVLAAFTYRDRYVREPTPEYSQAVKEWQPSLARNPDTASPRELKRFMNVSRYVVARGQADDPLHPDVPEPTIVEFCARWLLLRAQGVRATVDMLARSPDRPAGDMRERRRQAEWFLQVVGDISG